MTRRPARLLPGDGARPGPRVDVHCPPTSRSRSWCRWSWSCSASRALPAGRMPWRLTGTTGGACPPGATLDELGVLDGELLRLGPASPPPPAPVFDDPVDALAALTPHRRRDRRWPAVAAVGVTLAAAAAATVRSGGAGAAGRGGQLARRRGRRRRARERGGSPGATDAAASAGAAEPGGVLETTARGRGAAGDLGVDGSPHWSPPAARYHSPGRPLGRRYPDRPTRPPAVAAVAGGTAAASVRSRCGRWSRADRRGRRRGGDRARPRSSGCGSASPPRRSPPSPPRSRSAPARCSPADAAAGRPAPARRRQRRRRDLVAADSGPDLLSPAELADPGPLARGQLAGLSGGCAVVAAVAGAGSPPPAGGPGTAPALAAVVVAVLLLRARGFADPAIPGAPRRRHRGRRRPWSDSAQRRAGPAGRPGGALVLLGAAATRVAAAGARPRLARRPPGRGHRRGRARPRPRSRSPSRRRACSPWCAGCERRARRSPRCSRCSPRSPRPLRHPSAALLRRGGRARRAGTGRAAAPARRSRAGHRARPARRSDRHGGGAASPARRPACRAGRLPRRRRRARRLRRPRHRGGRADRRRSRPRRRLRRGRPGRADPRAAAVQPDGRRRRPARAGDLRSLAAAVRRAVGAGATVVNISGAVCVPAEQAAVDGRTVRSALRRPPPRTWSSWRRPATSTAAGAPRRPGPGVAARMAGRRADRRRGRPGRPACAVHGPGTVGRRGRPRDGRALVERRRGYRTRSTAPASPPRSSPASPR